MEIRNAFDVPASPAVAWSVLTDLERIAPCLPGAALTGRDADRFLGTVKVKVGPITASYKGEASFVSLDEEHGVAVLRAEGREQRGQGRASATVTATLTPHGEGTHVDVVVDLQIAGRVAQFGRGVLADVSAELMREFADRLADLLQTPPGEVGSEASSASDEAGEATDSASTEAEPVSDATTAPAVRTPADNPPLDVLGVGWRPLARRALAPVIAVAVVVAILLRRRGRRGRGA
ncbi:carbon monoxide dehydrogenase subunit G [Acidimicrobium ferrooxidans DSM 10331]|uniref:Carbon monoxide dehydrogenase subunit G n=1 Tax=Acidimicrobium ferrooxidans (strain DSM 10331 / JCM 15462 / NBRC 103882 / ICP) TaxID=525909 RepID=C7M0H7_ACIFD|nr:SRPBCC family protein [Acidimicrobium ferrooxidans]ACU54485.1 carbon monoxide dehydrogenase subunit G [Acidimicrobium ferrooxidans DSM 10331]